MRWRECFAALGQPLRPTDQEKTMNWLQLQSGGFVLASAALAWRGWVDGAVPSWAMAFALLAAAFACLLGEWLIENQ